MDKGVWALAIIRTAEPIHRVSPCGTKQTKWPRSGSPSIPLFLSRATLLVSLLPSSLLFFAQNVSAVTGKRRVTRFSKVLSPLRHPRWFLFAERCDTYTNCTPLPLHLFWILNSRRSCSPNIDREIIGLEIPEYRFICSEILINRLSIIHDF